MARLLALYLRKYPGVQVSYDGTVVDRSTVEELVSDYGLGEIQLQMAVWLPTARLR